MKSIFRGGVALITALLLTSLIFSAKTSVAEPVLSQFQQPKPEALPNDARAAMQSPKAPAPVGAPSGEPGDPLADTMSAAGSSGGATIEAPAVPALVFLATAYSLNGRTASGRRPVKGVIAADPSVLPLGSRVRIEAGNYSGEYLVADTGGAVRGKKIDIWTPTTREANHFGRRRVKLTVLSYGPRRASRRHRR